MSDRETPAQITADILETREYNDLLELRAEVRRQSIRHFAELWTAYAGTDWAPADHIIAGLLFRYDVDVVERAMIDVAIKVATGYVKSNGIGWLKYLHAVARNMNEAE